MANRTCPACKTRMAATLIQVDECPNCKRTDIDFYEYEIKALKARVAELEAQVAKYETPRRYTFHDLPELYERHATLTNVLKQLEEERDDTTP